MHKIFYLISSFYKSEKWKINNTKFKSAVSDLDDLLHLACAVVSFCFRLCELVKLYVILTFNFEI